MASNRRRFAVTDGGWPVADPELGRSLSTENEIGVLRDCVSEKEMPWGGRGTKVTHPKEVTECDP